MAGAVVAEPGPRLVARLIDTLIVGLPVALVARAALPEAAYGARPADNVTAIGVAGLYVVYDALLLAIWGRTVGKWLTGVRVVTAGERNGSVGLSRTALRAAVFALPIAARPIPVLSVLAGIFWVVNVGMVLEPTRRQALHDRIAATTVVRTDVDYSDVD
ncbi:MAG TPA: RDD family protein [Streptosporangiaceae bacterium]|jgi:uncharacterized RDD family membrane protein YckC